jgi:hypothetical protein
MDVVDTTIQQGGNMQHNFSFKIVLLFLSMTLLVSACSTFAPTAAPTDTQRPTATDTPVPTATSTPTRTPRPTATPNLAATQKAEEYQAEVQSYFDQGYLQSTDGSTKEYGEFSQSFAQLDWYSWESLGVSKADFFLSGHFKWWSAYRSASESGCGFVFAIQEDGSHYVVFLDRSRIIFLDYDTSYGTYSRNVGLTRGTGKVKFDNPFDHPVEADFTLIVNDTTAYVLVDKELIGQYTLAESRILRGDLGLTVLSGTNKDFGTRCTMTNLHLWTPK